MIQVAPGTKVHLATRPVRLRYGFDGLAYRVATVLATDPYSGHVFIFRSKRGDYLKILHWNGSGLCLFAKRLEHGRFVSYGLCQRRWACVTDRPPLGRRIVDAHDPHG